MSSKVAPLRGMKDLLPDEFRIHRYIEQIAKDVSELYGYEGFATPLLESANVFDRTLGETSDVISKEMYSFTDKKGRAIALRPEFTASIIRAFISNGLKQKLPLKLFSSGPIFRYDRPQEGRQRQFHQLNFEHIGANGAYSDAETISMAARLLEKLGLLNDVVLELNSLGCVQSREKYQAALIEYFKKHEDELSYDSKLRLEKNPLRILDSKDESDKKLSQNAPIISDYYTEDARKYFDEVKSYLDILGIKYTVNPRLARGLDYYSHTAFEFITSKLGAQGTILAGGRYDGLTKLMGDSEIPAIGFAAGIERIALMGNFTPEKKRQTVIIPIGDECFEYAVNIAKNLRDFGIMTTISADGKISKRMQNALSNNARYTIFIGSEELEKSCCKLKDLDNNSEQKIAISDLSEIILKNDQF
jgi:histidyl-tRNA synthetase